MKKIMSKSDLRYYMSEDALARGMILQHQKKEKIISFVKYSFNPDVNYRYIKTLRQYEYIINTCTSRSILDIFKRNWYGKKYSKYSLMTRNFIPPNCVGCGVYIPYGGVIITPLAQIGKGCTIESGVTIGIKNIKGCEEGGPHIGDGVIIGTGAKILGNVSVADGCIIGANAVVTKSILEKNVVVVGAPAKKVGTR